MKILEIFENKLRYKNYSQNTIKTYKQTLYQYFKETNCKDPYRISTKEIVNYLETKSFTSISQQNQFIGCLKLFSRFILNKKDIHLDKIERPRGEKKLPKIIEKEFLLMATTQSPDTLGAMLFDVLAKFIFKDFQITLHIFNDSIKHIPNFICKLVVSTNHSVMFDNLLAFNFALVSNFCNF